MDIKIEHITPTVAEYQKLRNTTDWEQLDNEIVEKGINNTLFAVCVFTDNSIIGTGRVIGDGAMYYYIQDVIVLPEYQGQGIGKLIMIEIEKYIKENANQNAFVGLMSADKTKDFYNKFGYSIRPENKPGMYKMIAKTSTN